MDSTNEQITTACPCHVVAMPFPGRGHINPMMNLCKLLVSKKKDILITFVVIEEWLGFIGSEPKPDNIRFEAIPNVVLPERLEASNLPSFNFYIAMTNMEAPFEQLLDRLELPVTAIIGDIEVKWSTGVAKRRNIPMAMLWTMSASVFSMFHHFDLHVKRSDATIDDLIEQVENIAGISSSNVEELRKIFYRDDPRVLEFTLDCVSRVTQAQYLLFTSVYEFEPEVIDGLRAAYNFPVYPIGPAIPYMELRQGSSTTESYIQWLDSQQPGSTLYISFGSFLSVSNTQMDEIAAGMQISGVRYLWMAREEASRLKERCGDTGLVVPWCDQLKVLCHPSIGGFWTHCGWNSILEAVFAGVPMLTFPLFLDQDSNSRQIVEDWGNGWRVKAEKLVSREEIAELVRRFMDAESNEGKKMRRAAKQIQDKCRVAISEGGSSAANLDAFANSISPGEG
ncbi:UDP-glucosyl transferase 87A2 [Hibiscus trionum]|uniref:UDP-glucosyl transferase 87A2 n=1 Tax=Hibiscus trionum TaxID=183268 RepID=A0A9W7HMA1_HIBTR|nr:UDP-glucosyl transferase 87A2 [Hibiscus trionum]